MSRTRCKHLESELVGTDAIGAGPYSLTYDLNSSLTELTRVDLVGKHWNDPHGMPIIEKLVLPNIPDVQTQVVMFENGELDLIKVDSETYHSALDPGHPFNPLLYVSPYGGLTAVNLNDYRTPLEDLLARKALAHSQDMEEIVKTVWGPTAVPAKGLISSHVPCHHSDADPHPYDPDLARQFLSDSSYGGVDNLPALMINLSRPDDVDMGRLIRAYWQNNLSGELEVRGRNDPLGQRRLGFIQGVDLEAHGLEREMERRGYVQFTSPLNRGVPIRLRSSAACRPPNSSMKSSTRISTEATHSFFLCSATLIRCLSITRTGAPPSKHTRRSTWSRST